MAARDKERAANYRDRRKSLGVKSVRLVIPAEKEEMFRAAAYAARAEHKAKLTGAGVDVTEFEALCKKVWPD